MTFLDYINLLRRRLLMAVLLTALVVGATVGLVSYKNMQPYQTTVFISIGNSQGTAIGIDPSYENVQAADHFSETVQGWFKNPGFQEKIKMRSSSEVSARKQEKQNLVLTFTSEQDAEGHEGSEKLKLELEKEINDYNSKTKSDFIIAIFSADSEQKPLSIPLFLIISLIGGIMLSSFALYGYEYLFQKVSFPSQAEELLKKSTEQLSSLTADRSKLHFLVAHLQKEEPKNIQIVGAGADTEKFTKTLEHLVRDKTLTNVNFPQESEKLNKHQHQLVVCVLGKTSLADLRKVKTLLSANFDLLILSREA